MSGAESYRDGDRPPSFVAWYRNPNELLQLVADCVSGEGGKWKSLQSDFVIVSRRDDGSLLRLSLIPMAITWLMRKASFVHSRFC